MTPYASAKCPTCGHALSSDRYIRTADELVSRMRSGSKPLDVYRATSGSWHLTYTRDVTVSAEAVEDAVRRGLIRHTYSTCSDSYGIGPTIDMDATMAERKRTGDRHLILYVGEHSVMKVA